MILVVLRHFQECRIYLTLLGPKGLIESLKAHAFTYSPRFFESICGGAPRYNQHGVRTTVLLLEPVREVS